jgi:hypothetical protein
MFRKIIEFFNRKDDKDFPEHDYVNYTDSYISQLNNEMKEEEKDEFFQKTT